VDIAPTILAIHNLAVPKSMDGRVLHELLIDNKNSPNGKARKEQLTTSVPFAGGTYTLTLQRTIFGEYQYVDFAKVVRVINKP
jgi:hypothetical protein